jgi:hypothetical protein
MPPIDWAEIARDDKLVATVANMRRCENVPGVFMLDINGQESSATAGDYFMYGEDEVLETDGEPNILVTRHCYLVNPLTGGPC